MNAALRVAYRRVPSFRREEGGLYNLYSGINTAIYSWRAKGRHNRGRHGPAVSAHGRCEWCGRDA